MPKLALCLAAVLLVCAPATQAEELEKPRADGYHVIKTIAIGGDGFWDCVTADSANRRLYIARSNRVTVVDMDTEKVEGEIPDLNGAHGAAVVPQFNRGFITSGKDDTIRVFDLKTLKQTDTLKGGKKPDVIVYEPFSKKVFAFNSGGASVTVIDPEKGVAAGVVELGGAPEFAAADGAGKLFVNLEDKSEIVVLDTATLKVTARWPLAPGEAPTGLAIDAQHHRLFSGCNESKTMVVLDSDSGKIVASFPIGTGCDGVVFDEASQNAFASTGDGTLTVVHEEDPATFKVAQSVATQTGARTCTLDEKNHQVWLVTATLKPAPDDKVEQNRQHKVIEPGSFSILIVGK
jgi:DNA-binding beta-propeller fold protein YncE